MSPKIGKFKKSIWVFACLVSALAVSTQKARATKIDVMTGWYSITAETATASSEISNFGLYRINYMISLLPKLELIVGYSLMMSDILGGDLGFGIDGSFVYYPISTSWRILAAVDNAKMSVDGIWRPYLGMGFSQRQFQSVQSTYAGFSFNVGVERSLARAFDIKGEIRYLLLQGTRDSTATELSAVGGVVFSF
ncbi:MAG: outer membrane beta-barrel protein [Bdellovibrionales bacterium]|nr:outer membrane beta-barrel protein [Bdellovibrionales bacterium]